jgi:hypothetical protein
MSISVTALPVTVQQVAIAVNQMSPADQEELLNLVPALRRMAIQPHARTLSAAAANVETLREAVLSALDGRWLAPDQPFVAGMTVAEYGSLPDEQRSKLWDDWAQVDLMVLEELEVSPDALSAG